MAKMKHQPADYLFWAVKQIQLSHLQFRILVTMCDAYGSKGCYLAQDTIAKRVGSTRPSVNRTIKELTELGLITCKGNIKESGARGSNNYEFPMSMPVPLSDTPVPSCDTPCTVGDTPPVPPAIHPPVPSRYIKHHDIKHPMKHPVKHTPIVPSEFDAFYAQYPKKVGRCDAEKAWNKLKPQPSLINRIMNDIVQRVEQGAWCTGKGKQYIPGPAPYLNQQRWCDEIIPRPEFKQPINYAAIEMHDLTEGIR